MFKFPLDLRTKKTKKFCTPTKEEYQSWVNYIKKTVGYASLLDYYELKVNELDVTLNRKT